MASASFPPGLLSRRVTSTPFGEPPGRWGRSTALGSALLFLKSNRIPSGPFQIVSML